VARPTLPYDEGCSGWPSLSPCRRASRDGARHARWLQQQHFDHPAHQIVLQEIVLGFQHAKERLERIEAAIAEFAPSWSLAPIVTELQALRGVSGRGRDQAPGSGGGNWNAQGISSAMRLIGCPAATLARVSVR
jgi:hypothetical protein